VSSLVYLINCVGEDIDAWYRDQPNNYNEYQGCMALSEGNSYKWGDEDCSSYDSFGYLCGYGESNQDLLLLPDHFELSDYVSELCRPKTAGPLTYPTRMSFVGSTVTSKYFG
jgi:hypothetical protein